MAKRWAYSLSHNKLNILKNCPRCFWLHTHAQKIEQPRGIFPSLPNGLDRIMKDYFDCYRGSMPPELRGTVPGVLWGSPQKIKKLRHWKSGLQAVIETPHAIVSLIGELDDLTVDNERFSVVDGKSHGDEVDESYTEKYNQLQGDVYALLLEENKMTPSGRSYFFHLSPDMIFFDDCVGQRPGPIKMQFAQAVHEIESIPQRAYDFICTATELIATADPAAGPMQSSTCVYCTYYDKRLNAGF